MSEKYNSNILIFIKDQYSKKPLFFILFIGFILRMMAAFYNYTPTAEDDYANIIEPALRHYQTGEEITTVSYRLPILPKLFYLFISPLKLMSVQSTAFIVSWGLMHLGLLSLLGIWGFYKLAGNFLDRKYSELSGWLYAIHFLMPFFSTRAFQESLTMSFVPFAFYFFTKFKKKDFVETGLYTNSRFNFLFSGFLVGLTVIIRFHFGVIAIVCTSILLVEMFRKRLRYSHFIYFISGGLIALLLLISLDIYEGRDILSTLTEYLKVTFEGNVKSDSYGASPWYTYILILMAVFIPPASFFLIVPFAYASRENVILALNLVVFVFLHSLIGNKLERFLLPVMPIFFLLTLQGLYLYKDQKLFTTAFRVFFILNLLLLLPVTLSRSQLNIIDAADYLSNSEKTLILYKIDLWKTAYYNFSKPAPVRLGDQIELKKFIEVYEKDKIQILSLGELSEDEILKINKSKFKCYLEKEFDPSWQEKIIIKLNPKFNARRDTSYLYTCSR